MPLSVQGKREGWGDASMPLSVQGERGGWGDASMPLSVQGEGGDGEMLACHCLYREREGGVGRC